MHCCTQLSSLLSISLMHLISAEVSPQRSRVTENMSARHISKPLWGKSFRRGAQPPFLCGNSLCTCYFLSNNGTIAHVCCSLNTAPASPPAPPHPPPRLGVCAAEFRAHYHSRSASEANIVLGLLPMHYATALS